MIPENNPLADETKENLKFLVEHFRKLAQDKDVVIQNYIQILEKFKPYYDRQESLMMRTSFYIDEINGLKNQIHELREELSKRNTKKTR